MMRSFSPDAWVNPKSKEPRTPEVVVVASFALGSSIKFLYFYSSLSFQWIASWKRLMTAVSPICFSSSSLSLHVSL